MLLLILKISWRCCSDGDRRTDRLLDSVRPSVVLWTVVDGRCIYVPVSFRSLLVHMFPQLDLQYVLYSTLLRSSRE